MLFPTKRSKRKRVSMSGIYHSCQFLLVCSCKMPNDGMTFMCTECKKWFHPKCAKLRPNMTLSDIRRASYLPCLMCKQVKK